MECNRCTSETNLQVDQIMKTFKPSVILIFVAALAVMVSIALFFNFTEPQVTQIEEGKFPEVTSERAGRAMAPANQPDGQTEPVPIQRMNDPLQQNVDPKSVTQTFEVETDDEVPRFEPASLRTQVGEVIKIIFQNESPDAHNWVLVRQDQYQEVGIAASQAGPDAGYIPILPDVILAHSKMVEPGKSEDVIFRAPDKAGNYTYICTYPGHWESEKGTLQVRE